MDFKCIVKLLLIFITINSYTQSQHTVIGLISDTNNKGIAYVNVLLIKATDSTLVKGTISSDNGTYKIDNINTGNYIIMSSFVGYKTTYSKPFNLNSDYKVETLILSEGEELNEVVVEAKKPLYQQKVDRMVINVENSIVSAGGTALEVLERSPGVNVNRQSNSISIAGKEGVVVMVNDKISYMPASSLVQMLEGMSADNIVSIELITTPPANFDAEGNAGYINIILKKRTDLGLNGSYTISGGYGNGVTNNNNLNFNYRKNKVNLYGSYGFSLDKRGQVFKTSRQYEDNGNLLASSTVTDRDPTQRNHNLRLGLDVTASEKTIVGLLVSAFDNRWSMDAINNSFDSENGVPTSYVILDNDEINHLKHYGINFNIKHNFTEDDFISFDADYINYKFDNPTNYENSFFDENNNFDRIELLRSGKKTPIETWVGKLDYSNKINDKIKIETGIKGTKSNFENDVNVDDFVNNDWVTDPSLTNKSDLDEKIYAAYGALDYSINEKTSMKVGMRYEHTNSKLDTDTQGTVVDRDYGIWFPSVFLNRQINDTLSLNLSYSKRITRPTFNDLAPFVIFFDPNTFLSGNASLQPAISNAFKFDVNYKSYFLSFQYTIEDSSIANFQERIDEGTGRLIFEAANLDYTKTFGITLGVPIKLTNWWRTQNNLTFIKQKVRAFYNDEPIELSLGNFSANSTHSFKISDTFSAELSGFYAGPGFFGSAKYDEVYGINLGLQKKFSEKWGTLKFSINDILDSIEFNGGTDLPEQNIKTRNTFDFFNRTFAISYSRNFGNSKLKSSRNRQTGSEEERQRVN
ncbi:TonB-dependent receptor [Sabulilitoribacter multivorans]|uniref:TonB-dependent receptor n=1 Tax=Flaviramulus multivorans TaxID=1304750 RepID=A0ABS9IKU0_9FLAO|nr:outer membrane beta-barrel family protein [Flaviramulus multivorans]MCF7561202.1 TonB-dependent receptor [Flaviramulus multivorans]